MTSVMGNPLVYLVTLLRCLRSKASKYLAGYLSQENQKPEAVSTYQVYQKAKVGPELAPSVPNLKV